MGRNTTATEVIPMRPPMKRPRDAFESAEHFHTQEGKSAMAQALQERRGQPPVNDPRAGLLYTPPEHFENSFTNNETATPVPWQTKLPPVHSGPSPPVSPSEHTLPGFRSVLPQDPPLYPTAERTAQSEEPLFTHDSQAMQEPPLVQEKPAAHEPQVTTESSPTVVPDAPRNVGGLIGPPMNLPFTAEATNNYYQARMRENERYRAARRLPAPTKSRVSERDPVSARQIAALRPEPAGVKKPRLPPRSATKSKAAKSTSAPTPPRIAAQSKPAATPKTAALPEAASPAKKATPSRRSTPKARTLQDFHDDAFPSDKSGSKHKRAAPSKKSARKEEDVCWRQIPDFTPPISSLDDAPRALKAVWGRGEPIDLSDDADVDELSPAEYAVAGELRLHAQAYLANKRRMFGKRLQYLKKGKSFTKTAAQNVCNIDVNKASKLWEAYQRVGWFDEQWFTPKYDDVALKDLEVFGSA